MHNTCMTCVSRAYFRNDHTCVLERGLHSLIISTSASQHAVSSSLPPCNLTTTTFILLSTSMRAYPDGEIYHADPRPDPKYAAKLDVVRYVLLGGRDDTAPIFTHEK